MEKNRYLTILDFEDMQVYHYENGFDALNVIVNLHDNIMEDELVDLIEALSHNSNNCQWIVSKNKPLYSKLAKSND